MGECISPGLIIKSPWVILPDVGVVAMDVTFGAPTGALAVGLPMLCLGGHPALECLLDVRGSGPTHDVAVSFDHASGEGSRVVERIAAVLRSSVPVQVVPPRGPGS